ncbi:ribokinase [uncultured Ruegeria sp.]|uniref:ribokinase n=1 Tax=uncultured Ruegeria sp. TaxID=259304 RepID=UPI00260F5B80|nr:ribokinase [uncultured Ruegeria sp.]
MLTIFGSINIDQVIRVPNIPVPGETVLGDRVMDTHGGKGANQAVAGARMGAGTIPVVMIGTVGDDAFGKAALQNFAENKVRADCTVLPDCATGTAFITLGSDGENAITVVPDANGLLEAAHASVEVLQKTSVLLCQGEVSLKETAHVMGVHRSANPNGTSVLNLAPVPQDGDLGTLRAALETCDILIVNEGEAEAICDLLAAPDKRDLSALAKAIGCEVVVTRGPDGADLFLKDGRVTHVSSPQIDPVDTTGAGDTFCGAFAALLAEGREMKPALAMACEAAAKACCAIGAQTGMPRRHEILKDTDPS